MTLYDNIPDLSYVHVKWNTHNIYIYIYIHGFESTFCTPIIGCVIPKYI